MKAEPVRKIRCASMLRLQRLRILRVGLRLLLICLAVGAFVPSCASDDSNSIGLNEVGPDSDGDPAIELDECWDSIDCSGGEICRDGFCREACAEEDTCLGQLTVCDVDLGFCLECVATEDCDINEMCSANGFCRFFCEEDAACASGHVCQLESGECVDRDCASDNECAGGSRCSLGQCVPIDPVVCPAGGIRCETAEVLTCNADGTAEVRTPCDLDEICIAGVGCSALMCQPFETGCVDDFNAFLCNATGTEVDELPCRDDQYCVGGACRNQICEPNEVDCDGNAVVECSSDGGHQEVTVCNDLLDCDSADFGCSCVSGDCDLRSCLPNSARCVGNSVQECALDGLGYLDLVDCDEEQICLVGECVGSSCTPNSTFCASDTLLTCNELGIGYRETNCSASEEYCLERSSGASCEDWVCQPDTAFCDLPGVAIQCDSRGASLTETVCGNDEYCDTGVCVLNVCSSEDPQVCLDGDVYTCAENGTGYELLQDCGSSVCVDGECRADLNISIELTWEGNADLDLHFLHPDGEWFSSPWDAWFENKDPDWDDPGESNNPHLYRDSSTAPGPESLNLITSAENIYVVGVHHYSGEVANATVRIVIDGDLEYEQTRTELGQTDFWEVAYVQSLNGNISEIDSVFQRTVEICENSIDDDDDGAIDCDDADCASQCSVPDPICLMFCLFLPEEEQADCMALCGPPGD